MHHTLIDPEKGDLCRIFAELTVAQARITPENAVAEIDWLILTAWRKKLPVYMELPSDIPYLEIDVPESPLKLEMAPSDQVISTARMVHRGTPISKASAQTVACSSAS